MTIAALYDIHGNLSALEAVLDDVRARGADEILIGGDVVPGPMAIECLDLLRGLTVPVHAILGNGEVALLAALEGGDLSHLPPPVQEVMRWTAARLPAGHRRWIAAWPATTRLDVPGVGRVLACHGTPRHENEIFTSRTAVARLEPVFAGVEADLVVCGHTHMPFDRVVGDVRVVNAGSVGMPFGRTGADWLLIGPGADVDPQHVDYDLSASAARVRASDYPQVEQAVESMTAPRTVDEMLAIYGKAELRYGPEAE